MSMWLWSITVLRFSYPGVAALRIITLPVLSTCVSRLWLSPQFLRYSIIFSSRFEGRGISLIRANCSNTHVGFKSLLVIILLFFYDRCLIFDLFVLPLRQNCGISYKIVCKINKYV